MKKLFIAIAMIMTTVVAMAQSQLYVIMKDGSGASFPESSVDEITFDNENGATIFGLKDIIKRMDAMQKSIDSLKNEMMRFHGEENQFEHKYVDLGLPSGLLWATTNVGARNTNEIGYYFAYGETVSKEEFSSTEYGYSKYDKQTFFTNKVVYGSYLDDDHDAATKLWGKEWMTPSSLDFQELLDNCTCSPATEKGQSGVKFVSKINQKSIFLPNTGYYKGHEVLGNYRGYYMTSTIGYSAVSNTLYTNGDEAFISTMNNSYGKMVRPVKKATRDDIDHKELFAYDNNYVDLGLPSGTLWASMNIGAGDSIHPGSPFIWGEVESRINPEEGEFQWFEVSHEELIEKGVVDENLNLTSKYDAASHVWGGNWRIPTEEEFNELMLHCIVLKVFDTENGVEGLELRGPNGNKIFLNTTTDYSYMTSTSYDEHHFTVPSLNDIEAGKFRSPHTLPHDKTKQCLIRPVRR